MQVRRHLKRLLRTFRDYVYVGAIRRVSQKTGINQILAQAYWKMAHLLSDETQVHLIAGQRVEFYTRSFTEFMRFRRLIGERDIIRDLLKSLRDDDVFYDVGANVGTYTCFAASRLPAGATVAFEPEPVNASRLEENLTLNGLEGRVLRVALSDTTGTTQLALTGTEPGEGSHAISVDGTGTTEVAMATGDGLIAEWRLPAPSVVKIDVEGAEMRVLRGLRRALENEVRLIYLEVHLSELERFGTGASEMEELLKASGFSRTKLKQRREQEFWRLERHG